MNIKYSLNSVLILTMFFGLPASAHAYNLCMTNWWEAFGMLENHKTTPHGGGWNFAATEAENRTISGRITNLVVAHSNSHRGRANEDFYIAGLSYREFTRYGTRIYAQMFITLESNPDVILGLRLKNEGDCGPSEEARFETLLKAYEKGWNVSINYMTVKNFTYVADAEVSEAEYIEYEHDHKNGLIGSVSLVPG